MHVYGSMIAHASIIAASGSILLFPNQYDGKYVVKAKKTK